VSAIPTRVSHNRAGCWARAPKLQLQPLPLSPVALLLSLEEEAPPSFEEEPLPFPPAPADEVSPELFDSDLLAGCPPLELAPPADDEPPSREALLEAELAPATLDLPPLLVAPPGVGLELDAPPDAPAPPEAPAPPAVVPAVPDLPPALLLPALPDEPPAAGVSVSP